MSAPVCSGKCKGTDRPAIDAPVQLVPIQRGGVQKKIVVCICCGAALRGRRVNLAEVTGDIAPALPADVSRAGIMIFDDPVCEFEYRLLPELRASA